ncbi:MAG TPA: GAF domain-containing protein [Thermoanaerobaculia bacterium]|nr:GAF domain-containing protein [Thermoanaerobaculia bacterium]
MTVRDYDTESPLPVEPLRLVSEIAHAVTHVQSEDLPRILSRILEAVRAVSGLSQGFVTLLDHAFNEFYVLESAAGSEPLRRKVSEVEQVPDFGMTPAEAGPRRHSIVPVRENDLLIELPVAAGTRELGLLCIVSHEDLEPGTEARQILETLASLAAIAIDRRRRRRDSLRLREWLDALWGVFTASRVPSSQEDVDRLFRAIADNALKISEADFVVLYEYFEQRGDVRLPPTLAGPLRDEAVLRGRGVQAEHGQSAVFRLLELKEPIFAEKAPMDWVEKGLMDAESVASERSFFQREGVVSSVGIPLRLDEERVGILFVNYRTEQNFSEEFREHLALFANYGALAIANARLFLRIQALNRELSALIHAGPYAVIAIDRKGRITELNAEAAALFRTGADSLRGQSVVGLYWDGIKEANRIQRLLEKKEKIRDEEIFGRARSGEKIPILLTAALLKNDSGEPVGSVGILQDLRLQSLRGRTQLLVRALREISNGEDLDDIVQLVVLYAAELLYADAGSLFLRVNEATFELKGACGVSAENLERLRSEEARGRLAELAAGGPRQIVFPADEGSPGELRLLPDARSSVLVPIHTEDRLLGLLLIESRQKGHFSADLELLEVLASQAAVSLNRVQLLRYREETRQGLLVSANAVAVGQIATSFVHEAKNSLNGMSLTVVNLLEDIDSEPDLKAKGDYTERLSVVLKAMERLDDLARRLQRFTRQGLRPEKRETYLNDIVTATIQLLESVLQRKQMRFEQRLDPSLNRPSAGRGNPIQVDEGQIQQVLMNLILNAVAASPGRSPVLLETRNHPDQVEVRISDHGGGISSDTKRKLFTPFFTTKRDGVGLGLFISRLMVEENHGGSIEILSTAPNKGTTFSVRIPKRT